MTANKTKSDLPFADNYNHSLVSLRALQRIKTYELLCEVTTNKKLLDFYWFNPAVVFNKIVDPLLYDGKWVNSVYVHMTPQAEIIICNKVARLSINTPNGVKCYLSFADNNVNRSNVKDGLLPILMAVADLAGYDYSEPVVKKSKPVSAVKPSKIQTVKSAELKPRRNQGQKKSTKTIKDIISRHVNDVSIVETLDTIVVDIYDKLISLGKVSISKHGVKIGIQPNNSNLDSEVSLLIESSLWSVSLPIRIGSKVTVYTAFAHVDEGDENDIKEIVKVIKAIHSLL